MYLVLLEALSGKGTETQWNLQTHLDQNHQISSHGPAQRLRNEREGLQNLWAPRLSRRHQLLTKDQLQSVQSALSDEPLAM
jgi:hypothetical protein